MGNGDKEKNDQQKGKWRKFADELEEKEAETPQQNESPASLSEEQDQEGITFPSRKELEDQLTKMEMQLQEYQDRILDAYSETSDSLQ